MLPQARSGSGAARNSQARRHAFLWVSYLHGKLAESWKTGQKQETPPTEMAGFLETFAVRAARWTATANILNLPNAREIYSITPTKDNR